jgi:hypothetical protein
MSRNAIKVDINSEKMNSTYWWSTIRSLHYSHRTEWHRSNCTRLIYILGDWHFFLDVFGMKGIWKERPLIKVVSNRNSVIRSPKFLSHYHIIKRKSDTSIKENYDNTFKFYSDVLRASSTRSIKWISFTHLGGRSYHFDIQNMTLRKARRILDK